MTRDNLTTGRRGVTLSELLVAMSIGSIVISMALSGILRLSGEVSRIQQQSIADEEARLLAEYLGALVRTSGGGALRPYAALWVSNSASDTETDSLVVAHLKEFSQQCVVTSYAGSRVSADADDTCCFSEDMEHAQAVIITGDADGNSHWMSVQIRDIDTSGCALTVDSGIGAASDHPPALDTTWIGATLAPVSARQIWLDASRDALMLRQDSDGDGVLEESVLADRVLDLQLALGYDSPPWDWQIVDGASTEDEWLYNAYGDVLGSQRSPGLQSARETDLRMVRIGVVVGAPVRSADPRHSRCLLDGPQRTRPGWVLGSAQVSVGLRNHQIMR